MPAQNPNGGEGFRPAGVRLPSIPDPRTFLCPTGEELRAVDTLLAEHQRMLAITHEHFLGYLDGRYSACDWEDARRAADRARIAYERKCEAILVRTFRI